MPPLREGHPYRPRPGLAIGFPFFIHVGNMSCDLCFVSPKKSGHLAFGEPNRILDEFGAELNFAIFRFKQHDFMSHIAPARPSSTAIIFSQSSIRGKKHSAHCGIAAFAKSLPAGAEYGNRFLDTNPRMPQQALRLPTQRFTPRCLPTKSPKIVTIAPSSREGL